MELTVLDEIDLHEKVKEKEKKKKKIIPQTPL